MPVTAAAASRQPSGWRRKPWLRIWSSRSRWSSTYIFAMSLSFAHTIASSTVENIEAVSRGRVDRVPPLVRDDDGLPRLRLARCEDPACGDAHRGEVRVLRADQDLEVDEVVRALVARPVAHPRAGVELLRNLMIDREEGDGGRLREPDSREEFEDVVGDPELGRGGAPYIVMAQLEVDRHPRTALARESDLEQPHDVLGWDRRRHPRRRSRPDRCREAVPARLEVRIELVKDSSSVAPACLAASRSRLNRVCASPRRTLSAVPPLMTPGGSIWPTTTFATRRSRVLAARAFLFVSLRMRAWSAVRLRGSSVMPVPPAARARGQPRCAAGARAPRPRSRPRAAAPSSRCLRSRSTRDLPSCRGWPRRPSGPRR